MSERLSAGVIRGRCKRTLPEDFVWFGYVRSNNITFRKFNFDGDLIESGNLGNFSCRRVKRYKDIIYYSIVGSSITPVRRMDLDFNSISGDYNIGAGNTASLNADLFVNKDYVIECRNLSSGNPNVSLWDRETLDLLWDYRLSTSAQALMASLFNKVYIGRNYHSPSQSNLTVLDTTSGDFIQNRRISQGPTSFGVPAVNIFGHSLCMGNVFTTVKTDLNFNEVFSVTLGSFITAITQDSDYNVYIGDTLGTIRKRNPSGGLLDNVSLGGQINGITIRKGIVFVAHNRANGATNTALTDDLSTVLWTYDHGANCNSVTT